MLDGRTGFLVTPDDAEEMADAIERLLVNKELAAEMGKEGKNRVIDMFTKERYARQVEEIYFKLLTQAEAQS
jgi:glycosyltransferase involved in cell wall biosynthesis